MRYYVYISDAKVEMLLPQVPGAVRRKVAVKFGFDLKLLSGSVAAEGSTLDNRVARLQAVEAYLLEHEPVGTPDRPASWIQGDTDMKVVDIGGDGIFFIKETPSWILALGGSAKHLIGNVAPEKVGLSYSYLPYLIDRLNFLVEKKTHLILKLPEESLPKLSSKAQGFDAWITAIRDASHQAKGPSQQLHFLAKRLASGTSGDMLITMATPLYVALEQ